MSVWMRHAGLPDNPPIEVADSAAPQYGAGGWEPTDPPAEPQAATVTSQPQRAVSVRMRHPDLDDEITVAQSAVPFHTASGWSVIEDTPKEQAAGEPDGEKTKSERPAPRTAKKKEQG